MLNFREGLDKIRKAREKPITREEIGQEAEKFLSELLEKLDELQTADLNRIRKLCFYVLGTTIYVKEHKKPDIVIHYLKNKYAPDEIFKHIKEHFESENFNIVEEDNDSFILILN